MSNSAITWLFKIGASLALLVLGGSFWYYTMGRKPHVLISAAIKPNERGTTVRSIAPNEVLLLSGTKATLYDLTTKKARWSANVGATPAPTPTPKPVVKAVAAPTPAPEKPDRLLETRVKRRFAKLEQWAAELNTKRTKLKTPLQIENFNLEAAKYHAELTAARQEAAVLHPAQAAMSRAARDSADESMWEDHDTPARTEIATLSQSVWIADGKRVTGLDRTDGHVLKTVPLPGNVVSIERGADELFVIAAIGESRNVQVTRVAPGNEPAKALAVTIPPEPIAEEWREGTPQKPPVADHRILFSADHSSLLQLDVRLVEKKLTEHQTMAGESGSDLEAADKKTTGGFGNDALVFAQALGREAERDATGGKEIIDESTYQISLQRPFAPTIPAATAQIHGPAELISTPTLDLIVAGRELVAFDHSNKKLWQTMLAQPIAPSHRRSASRDEETAANQPCLESGDRLYFFDAACLSAFARETGQPAWRLPLKGIHKVQLDNAGRLYVATQTGELDGFSQLLQIEAKSGRIIWKVEKYEDAFVSGSDLYVTRETRNAEDAVNAVFDRSKAPQCRWKLYKLSTRNAEPQWEWFQTRRPTHIEADHKRVALLFADELQILTSIAL